MITLLLFAFHIFKFDIILKLKLKIFIGMSAKLIGNGHLQIYKYTEYGFEHNCKI